MAPDEFDAIARAFTRLTAPGPLLEIGSRDVNGTIRLITPAAYTGVDWDSGDNVDARASGHALPFADDTFATVVCNSTLEHDPFFFRTVYEMYRVAVEGATFVVGVPTYGFPYHKHPVDCYRLTPDAFSNFVLTGCRQTAIERVARCGPPRLCGSGTVRGDWSAAIAAAERHIPRPYEGAL